MIEIKDVSYSYKDACVLDSVSMEINKGQFIGIIGGNGAGKTTLVKLIIGLIKPDKGRIIRQKDIKVSYVRQTTADADISFPASALEIVESGLTDKKSFFMLRRSNRQKAVEIMKSMDIYELRKHLISELSGGQQQKVKIAKALVSDPDLIVLDEPDEGMDQIGHAKFIELIDKLHEQKKTIIFVSHHPDDLKNADKIYAIEDSRIKTIQRELNYVSI